MSDRKTNLTKIKKTRKDNVPLKLSPDPHIDKIMKKMDKEDSKMKWSTLRHNGLYFPDKYVPLPSKVHILYDRIPLKLDSKNTDNPFNISSEEAAYYFARTVEMDRRLADNKKRLAYSNDRIYRQNFWKDWKKILKNDPNGKKIKDFDKVDFTPMANYIRDESERKKAEKKVMTKEEKALEKERKEEIKNLYGYAIVDGVKIPTDYVVQPPGIFAGHSSPLRGKIKNRISPEDVVINVSLKHKPVCYVDGKPCKWKDIVENRKVTWLAQWRNPVTGKMVQKTLNRIHSHFVKAKDMDKFDMARKLDKNISNLRKVYRKDFKSKSSSKQQLAVAVYILDLLSIRPGTEKDEKKEGDTLGLTTLKCENVQFLGNNKITFKFKGKSSIDYKNTVDFEKDAYKILKKRCGEKSASSMILNHVTPETLNDYIKSIVPGVTAKVFRTRKASSMLQRELEQKKNMPDIYEPVHNKKIIFEEVLIKIALQLNHKRMADNTQQIIKTKDKIKEYEKKLEEARTENQKNTARKNIQKQKLRLKMYKENISIETSKTNYIDPRIVVCWAKKSNAPIEKLYNKSQLKKFVWAMNTNMKWKF